MRLVSRVKMRSGETGIWTRRQMIGGLGALLAAGCWPGSLRAAPAVGAGARPGGGAAGNAAKAGEFSFVVANDFHHDNAECDAWFEKLFRQIGGHPGVAFCAGLGDLANHGRPESIAAIARLSAVAGVPFHPVPGNHDNDLEESTRLYAEVLPGKLNYTWTHAGWQCVALDTTDGKKWGDTRVSPTTLAWLDAIVPTLEAERPTLLFTHFPLTPVRNLTPLNAEDVLARFTHVNLRGAFSGHYHGRTLVRRGECELVTDVCCSRVATNHDGSVEKGYWLCEARADGRLERQFVNFTG